MASRPPKNFTGTTGPASRFDLATENGFDALYAAAFRGGSELYDQETSQAGAGGA